MKGIYIPYLVLCAACLLTGCVDYTEDFEYYEPEHYESGRISGSDDRSGLSDASASRPDTDAYSEDYLPSPSPRRRSPASYTNAPMPNLNDRESFEISPIASTELPAQLKRELPDDPHTKALNHVIAPNAVMATLSSSRTEADAFAHYLEGIGEKGWIIETAFEIAGRKTIRAGRGDSQMTLTFQASGEELQITVLVASAQSLQSPSDLPIPLP